MGYRAFEKNITARTYAWRQRLYGPLCALLTKWRVTPNQITNFRAVIFVALVLYPLFTRGAVAFSYWMFLIVFWGLDTLDGALARHQRSASDKGRFLDLFVDVTAYSFFILGLAYLEVASVFILFYHVIIHGTLYCIASIYKNENAPSNWLMHAEPNLIYLKFLPMLFIAVFVTLKVNLLDLVFGFFNILMTILALVYFVKLQKQRFVG